MSLYSIRKRCEYKLKIWLLYLNDNDYNKFHGYTTNYSVIRHFFSSRDEKKFTIKIKEIHKKKYAQFKKIYSNYELKMIEYYTHDKNIKKSISILSNNNEHNETMDLIHNYIWKISDYTFDSYFLDKKYRVALDTLVFSQIYKFTKEKEDNIKEYISFPCYNSYGKPENFIIDEFLNRFYYDDFKFFLKIYKNTFKK